MRSSGHRVLVANPRAPVPWSESAVAGLAEIQAAVLWALAGGVTGTARAKSTGPDIRVITRSRSRLVVLMCRQSPRIVLWS